MRYLGIDYGTKRVGIALSDESGKMAFPHSVLENNSELLKSLAALLEEKKVEEIVIGHSVDKEGKDNILHEKVKELIGDLTLETGLPVHLESEIYTTQEAIREQGRNDMTDASAATIILNSFLARR
jgi:putative Holliday junction resolvase